MTALDDQIEKHREKIQQIIKEKQDKIKVNKEEQSKDVEFQEKNKLANMSFKEILDKKKKLVEKLR